MKVSLLLPAASAMSSATAGLVKGSPYLRTMSLHCRGLSNASANALPAGLDFARVSARIVFRVVEVCLATSAAFLGSPDACAALTFFTPSLEFFFAFDLYWARCAASFTPSAALPANGGAPPSSSESSVLPAFGCVPLTSIKTLGRLPQYSYRFIPPAVPVGSALVHLPSHGR